MELSDKGIIRFTDSKEKAGWFQSFIENRSQMFDILQAIYADVVRKNAELTETMITMEKEINALGSGETKLQRTAGADPVPDAPGKELAQVLLVDDNEKNRILVQGFLRKAPCRIETAEDGARGLEMFKAAEYDVVFMDIEMPMMDGYTATRAMRQWENERGLAPTPIIALTAYALSGHRQKSLAAGCSDHLSKPIKNIVARYAPKEG